MFKRITHAIAVAGTAGIAWAVSPQGQQIIGSIIHAYPKLSGLAGVIGFAAALYHSPKSE
jgi:hypothetical protein